MAKGLREDEEAPYRVVVTAEKRYAKESFLPFVIAVAYVPTAEDAHALVGIAEETIGVTVTYDDEPDEDTDGGEDEPLVGGSPPSLASVS